MRNSESFSECRIVAHCTSLPTKNDREFESHYSHQFNGYRQTGDALALGARSVEFDSQVSDQMARSYNGDYAPLVWVILEFDSPSGLQTIFNGRLV